MAGQNPVFIPGPTNIPDRLRHAVSIQTMDHRSPDFGELLAPLLADLKKVFKTTSGQVFMFPASGTGGWEAAIANTLSPGDKVLAARHGMFSRRWIDLCRRHRLDVEAIECEWGAGAPADRFGALLEADRRHEFKAVLVTHNETATGVRSDVAAVRRAMDACNHPAMLFADCVSSLASMDFRMEEWGVDVAVTGSQKGFMLPTGMAIVGVSPKGLEVAGTAACPRTYFDFCAMAAANARGGFPYTPPLQLMCGLRASVDMLFEEGLENVFARHRRIPRSPVMAAAVPANGLTGGGTSTNGDCHAQKPTIFHTGYSPSSATPAFSHARSRAAGARPCGLFIDFRIRARGQRRRERRGSGPWRRRRRR